MSLDSVLKIFDIYEIPPILIFFLFVLANILGLWLAQTFFPMYLKKKAWEWEKRKWAIEQFIETLSQVEFIGKHFIREEVQDKVSLSMLSFKKTEEEIVKIITNLHRDGYRIRPYLNKHNQQVFDEYLNQSAAAFDASKESHGEWMPDDYAAEEGHRICFIHEQTQIAGKLCRNIKFS